MNKFPCDIVTQFEGTYDIQGSSTRHGSDASSDSVVSDPSVDHEAASQTLWDLIDRAPEGFQTFLDFVVSRQGSSASSIPSFDEMPMLAHKTLVFVLNI